MQACVADRRYTWGARRYIDRLMQSYKGMFGEDPKKRAIYAPLDESCHPKLDDSPLYSG